jgi:hypothetical protein
LYVIPAQAGIHEESSESMAGCVVPLAFTQTWYDPRLWYPRDDDSELPGIRGENVEDRGEVCLAEEVERFRRLGLTDGEIASRMGVEASWVETVVSSGEDEPGPDSEDRAVAET